ncbi:MAG TPA: helix-turn-helix transcriptional regulator, partial [Solirubrobacteraceae bacterium]
RLADARADAEAALELFDEAVDGPSPVKHAWYVLAAVAIHTDDRRALAAAAGSAAALRADDALNLRRTGDWIAALLADAEGDGAAAVAAAAETVAALGTPSPKFAHPHDASDLLALLRLLLRAEDRERAAAVVAESERRAALNPEFPLFGFLARHARALLERDPEAMRAAAEGVAHLPGTLVQALALEDAADVLVEHDRDAAVDHFDAALKAYGEAGADRDVARVRRRLRDLGVRRRRLASTRPVTGWAGLTDAELAVVRLVAEGATNRQAAQRLFLSPHTVSSHLRHAFEKLTIRSRVELAMLYAEREADAARAG